MFPAQVWIQCRYNGRYKGTKYTGVHRYKKGNYGVSVISRRCRSSGRTPPLALHRVACTAMPPVANPNPDRARRASVEPAAEAVRESLALVLVPAPKAPAPIVTRTAPAASAAPAAAQPLAPMFGHAPVRKTRTTPTARARMRRSTSKRAAT